MQRFEELSIGDVPGKAAELKEGGWRMVQICGIPREGGAELLYSFDRESELLNLKVGVPDGERVGSITPFYWSAFVYENEVHDLFGVEFHGMALDYKGNFFRIAEKHPWKSPGREGERYGQEDDHTVRPAAPGPAGAGAPRPRGRG